MALDQTARHYTQRTRVGWKIFYGDGTVVRARTAQEWRQAPSLNIQCIVELYAESYRCWNGTAWEGRRYRRILHGKDFYWPITGGYIEGGLASEVPGGLPNGAVKEGLTLLDTDFKAIYNRAYREEEIDNGV